MSESSYQSYEFHQLIAELERRAAEMERTLTTTIKVLDGLSSLVTQHAQMFEAFLGEYSKLVNDFNEHGHRVSVHLDSRKTLCSRPVQVSG